MFAIAAAGTSARAAEPVPTVVVRSFDYTTLRAEEIAATRLEAARIFRIAKIRIEWIDCRVPRKTAGVPCLEPFERRGDLMLRLLDRTPPASKRGLEVLGESILDRSAAGGVLMTVDLAPVRVIANQSGVRPETLLGRAIAHEIGHLLLATPDHARAGLMRARWSNDELSGRTPAGWGFSSKEAAEMRQALKSARLSD